MVLVLSSISLLPVFCYVVHTAVPLVYEIYDIDGKSEDEPSVPLCGIKNVRRRTADDAIINWIKGEKR